MKKIITTSLLIGALASQVVLACEDESVSQFDMSASRTTQTVKVAVSDTNDGTDTDGTDIGGCGWSTLKNLPTIV